MSATSQPVASFGADLDPLFGSKAVDMIEPMSYTASANARCKLRARYPRVLQRGLAELSARLRTPPNCPESHQWTVTGQLQGISAAGPGGHPVTAAQSIVAHVACSR